MTDTINLSQNTASDADTSIVLNKEDLTVDLKDPNLKSQLNKLKKLVDAAERALDSAKDVMEAIMERKDYKSMPGVEGKYDGKYIIASDGSKHEVPSNYAAKSRLVYGDILKIIEEDGKKVFKQIEKVARKNLEGVVTKKEGKWHVLTEAGSHLLLDRAIEFNQVKLKDLIDVVLPESNLSAPFAAFNKVVKSEAPAVITQKSESNSLPKPSLVKKQGQSFKGVGGGHPVSKPTTAVVSSVSRAKPKPNSSVEEKKPVKVVNEVKPKIVALPNETTKDLADLDDLR